MPTEEVVDPFGIAAAIADVSDKKAAAIADSILRGQRSTTSPVIVGLAAAVRNPMIWAAVEEAHRRFELSRRPVVSRQLSAAHENEAELRRLDVLLGIDGIHELWSAEDVRREFAPWPDEVKRDKGESLARRARCTPAVRR